MAGRLLLAFRWWWSRGVVNLLLLVTVFGAQQTQIETRMLDLWLELIVPVGVCTKAENVEAQGIEGIVEYFDKVILAYRSPSIFGATGLEISDYGFELLSAPLGGLPYIMASIASWIFFGGGSAWM